MKTKIFIRIAVCAAVLAAVGAICYRAFKPLMEKAVPAAAETAQEETAGTLTLWYTDEKLNPYLVDAAAKYQEKTGTEVILQLATAVDYIELINRASISDSGGPDLFITSSELLNKARRAGLTVENDTYSDKKLSEDFPKKALDAATCGGKLVAYPFYFETSCLLYNSDYVEGVPTSIDDILTYSDTFEATESMENVENIFKWNVADIFSNFFFIANYVNLGGPAGDDRTQVQLDAPEVVSCLEYYQNLNGFFAIDAESVTTESVLQEFIEGKTIYTIAKTDAIAALEEAGVPYGIGMVPALTEELKTKGLSVTNSVVVNAYSKNRENAKNFAKFITFDQVDSLYSMTNKMPVKLGVKYENEKLMILLEQYEESVEVPKITDLSDYWILMEIAFANIWQGSDVQTEIRNVADQVASQLQ